MLARCFGVQSQTYQHASRDAVAFAEKTKKNVFRSNVRVTERDCLLCGQRENLFDAGRVRNVPDHHLFRSHPDLFLDFATNTFKIEPGAFEDGAAGVLPDTYDS